jgi:hypothetical protein
MVRAAKLSAGKMALSQFEQQLRSAVRRRAPSDVILRFLNTWYDSLATAGIADGWLEVFNEAAALTADEEYGSTAWTFFRDLAALAHRSQDSDLKCKLTIALFEIIAEPPHYAESVAKLFSLLDDAETRWAVFDAYERWPRTFRRHIALYANGRISDAEYKDWLEQQGLVLTSRGLRYR